MTALSAIVCENGQIWWCKALVITRSECRKLLIYAKLWYIITAQEDEPSPFIASRIPFSLCKLETVIFFLSIQRKCIYLRSSWLTASEFLFPYCLCTEKYITTFYEDAISWKKIRYIVSLSSPINAEMNSNLQLVGNGLKIPGTGDLNPTYKHRCFTEGLHQTPVPNFSFVWSWLWVLHSTLPESQNFLPSWCFALYKQQCR